MAPLASTAVLFSLTVAAVLQYGSASDDILARNISVNFCRTEETDCLYGCCRFPNGVCCPDGLSCCKHGQVCLRDGTCLYLSRSPEGEQSIASNQSTPVRSTFLSCPYGSTECINDMCCPLPDATCCQDGQHCCPHGYSCGADGRTCSLHSIGSNVEAEMSVPASKTVGKSPYKSCPGSRHSCPNSLSCCLNDSWKWGCCPKASPSLRQSAIHCCQQKNGFLCCPFEDRPVCTYDGCVAG